MLFRELPLTGAFVIDLEPIADDRGFFARCFAAEEFVKHGLATEFPHCNLSRNRRRGTLRGMHYSLAPSAEAKLVRCTTGAVFDVIVDLRPDASTYRRWASAELTAENGRAMYVPAGFAHGFLTLTEDTDVFYQMGDVFRPETARGCRWNDAAFEIAWPESPTVLSPRDASYPDFNGVGVMAGGRDEDQQ